MVVSISSTECRVRGAGAYSTQTSTGSSCRSRDGSVVVSAAGVSFDDCPTEPMKTTKRGDTPEPARKTPDKDLHFCSLFLFSGLCTPSKEMPIIIPGTVFGLVLGRGRVCSATDAGGWRSKRLFFCVCANYASRNWVVCVWCGKERFGPDAADARVVWTGVGWVGL